MAGDRPESVTDCDHEIILNGRCLECGDDDIVATIKPPPTPQGSDFVPLAGLKKAPKG